MVRPLKADRESIALTTVRVSAKTKRLLQELKQKHQFATIDQVLRYYLPSNAAENRPIFHSAREIYDLTKHNPDIDRLIKDTSNQIMHKINKSAPSQPKTKPVHNNNSWRKRRNW